MESRIVHHTKYFISGSSEFFTSYLSPIFIHLKAYLNKSSTPHTTQPLALPAPPPVLLLMPAPAVPSPSPKQAKKRRDKTDFSTNITASLALAKKQTAADNPNSVLATISTFSSHLIQNLFRGTKTSTTAQMIKTDTVAAEMEALEQQLENHPQPDDILLKKIELVTEQIRLHAMMRVDLFFYLLLAVRGTYAVISKDETIKQHGNGSKKAGTHACHSSLFPNIKIEPGARPPRLSSWSFGLFGAAQPNYKMTPIIKGTYFEDALNATVELPEIVNGFDGHLEGRFQQTVYVKECIDIINRVSRNEIDPITAMNQFFKTMNAFFTHMEYDYIKKPKKLDYPKSFARVWQCEKSGTFSATNEGSLTLSSDYLYMMLRINYRADKLKCATHTYFLETHYEKIQKEILETPSPLSKASKSA